MSSPLLAIAHGLLAGGINNREKSQQDDERDLQRELQLRSMPGVTLEPTGARAAADVAQNLGGILGAGAGAIAPIGVGGGTAPGQDAGTAHLGGRSMNVRFDPTQTPAGRQVARDTANRTAHAQLQKLDPASWGSPYDPGLEYGEALRGENQKADKERQLIAAGVKPELAKVYARTGLDLEQRRAQINRTNAEADKARRPAAGEAKAEVDVTKQTESDAGGTALGWATNALTLDPKIKPDDATLQQQIADGLAPMYPQLSYAQRVGVAARAIVDRDTKAANIGAKNRSGVKGPAKGLRIPGVNLSALPATSTVKRTPGAGAPLDNPAATAQASATAAGADKAKTRAKVIAELVDAGKTKEEIKTELTNRGLR